MKPTVKLLITLVAMTMWSVAGFSASSTISIQVGTFPTVVAVNQTTNQIYVSNQANNSVSVIDGNTTLVVATVPVGTWPQVVEVNSMTNMVYVANLLSNNVTVIDGKTNSIAATIAGLSAPFGIAVNASTNQIFVSNSNIDS